MPPTGTSPPPGGPHLVGVAVPVVGEGEVAVVAGGEVGVDGVTNGTAGGRAGTSTHVPSGWYVTSGFGYRLDGSGVHDSVS